MCALTEGLRDGLAGSAARVLEAPAAGLLPRLVVGDTRAMDPVLTEDFRRAGLSHLTAVSGDTAAWQGECPHPCPSGGHVSRCGIGTDRE